MGNGLTLHVAKFCIVYGVEFNVGRSLTTLKILFSFVVRLAIVSVLFIMFEDYCGKWECFGFEIHCDTNEASLIVNCVQLRINKTIISTLKIITW